jgi:hypothetical protein
MKFAVYRKRSKTSIPIGQILPKRSSYAYDISIKLRNVKINVNTVIQKTVKLSSEILSGHPSDIYSMAYNNLWIFPREVNIKHIREITYFMFLLRYFKYISKRNLKRNCFYISFYLIDWYSFIFLKGNKKLQKRRKNIMREY